MRKSKESHQNDSQINWQILGELKLNVKASFEEAIREWLIDMLRPLNLHQAMFSKVVKSIQDSTTSALQDKADFKYEHIHLLIFASTAYKTRAGTWGFFRIEKNEYPVELKSNPEHEIKLYLYLEDEP